MLSTCSVILYQPHRNSKKKKVYFSMSFFPFPVYLDCLCWEAFGALTFFYMDKTNYALMLEKTLTGKKNL